MGPQIEYYSEEISSLVVTKFRITSAASGKK